MASQMPKLDATPATVAALWRALFDMTEVYWGVNHDNNGDGSPPPDCVVKAREALFQAQAR